jgi:aminopeptidase N
MRRWMMILVAALALLPANVGAQAAPGCTSGSGGFGDGYFPWMGNSGYDVRHYTLDLDLDVDAGSIRAGTATILALATDTLCRFNLDFSGLEIDGLTVNGAPAAWSRSGQELTVEPARPLAAGADFLVQVDYHGSPIALETSNSAEVAAIYRQLVESLSATPEAMATPVDAGDMPDVDLVDEAIADDGDTLTIGMGAGIDQYGWSIGGWWTAPGQIFIAGEPRGAETWYPVNGHPADKATYTMRLTVDLPYDVAANGERVAVTEAGGKRTVTWHSADPMASFLVTFYAGEIDIVETVAADGLPLRYAYGAGVAPWQREQMEEATPQMIAFFAERFGAYPFAVGGGMIVDAMLYFALETQTIPIHGAMIESPELDMPREVIAPIFDEVLAHELAHQWFGNNVSPLRWQDVYLSEGLTTYATYLWLGEREGHEAMEQALQETWARLEGATRLYDPEWLAAANGADYLAALGIEPEWIAGEVTAVAGGTTPDDLAALSSGDLADGLKEQGLPVDLLMPTAPVPTGNPGMDDLFAHDWVYERGALATHALRVAVGDETFYRIMQAWTERLGGGNATVQDFIALAEAESGQDLEPLFDAWLFGTVMPPFPVVEES